MEHGMRLLLKNLRDETNTPSILFSLDSGFLFPAARSGVTLGNTVGKDKRSGGDRGVWHAKGD